MGNGDKMPGSRWLAGWVGKWQTGFRSFWIAARSVGRSFCCCQADHMLRLVTVTESRVQCSADGDETG